MLRGNNPHRWVWRTRRDWETLAENPAFLFGWGGRGVNQLANSQDPKALFAASPKP